MSVETETTTLVNVGDEAPEFKGRDDSGELVTLSDFRGKKNVMLVFYPYAFSGTCTKEFCQLRDENADLEGLKDTEIIGVSTDPVHSLRAWKAQEHYINRCAVDIFAFEERLGAPVRNSFLIDKEGVVRYAEHNGLETLAIARDQKAWRKAIEALK